jgi:hypothetical protein
LRGVDYRPVPLGERKKRLASLGDRRLAGIAMVDHTDGRGELVFEAGLAHGAGRYRVETAVEALSVRHSSNCGDASHPKDHCAEHEGSLQGIETPLALTATVTTMIPATPQWPARCAGRFVSLL